MSALGPSRRESVSPDDKRRSHVKSGAWRTNQGRDTYESVDGDDDPARDAHSRSDRGEHDGYEVRMQEIEARVNIPSHEQSTKDFLSNVIRGLLVLQRSGL